jgi:hypothetical protein
VSGPSTLAPVGGLAGTLIALLVCSLLRSRNRPMPVQLPDFRYGGLPLERAVHAR